MSYIPYDDVNNVDIFRFNIKIINYKEQYLQLYLFLINREPKPVSRNINSKFYLSKTD